MRNGGSQTDVSLPWGNETLDFSIPEPFYMLAYAQPRILPGLSDEDVNRRLKERLSSPTGSKPLRELAREANKILFIVDDIGRPTPAHKLMGTILQTVFEARGKEEKFPLLFATGVHREMTPDEMKNKIGAENFSKVYAESHNAYKKESLVYAGETKQGTKIYLNKKAVEADLRILVGTIEPHVQAGFGGGYKNILPGCAGPDSIGHNHYIGATPELFSMIGYEPEKNPMRLDIEEACGKLSGTTFIVNTILNPGLEIVDMAAGDPVLAHRKGIELARQMYGVEIPEPADVVISNSHPLDVNFRQAVKGIANVLYAVKDDGVLVSFQHCALGFDDLQIKSRLITGFPEKLLRKILKLFGKQGIHKIAGMALKSLPPEQRFFTYFALQALRRNHILIFSQNLRRDLEERNMPLFVEKDVPALFRKILSLRNGKRPLSVHVFPWGGVTYPILPPTLPSPHRWGRKEEGGA